MAYPIKCRACGAQIFFVKTVKGKSMPVDAEPVRFIPDTAGRDRYVLEDGTVLPGCRALGDEPDIHTGWISHFATCPSAAEFRRGRGRA